MLTVAMKRKSSTTNNDEQKTKFVRRQPGLKQISIAHCKATVICEIEDFKYVNTMRLAQTAVYRLGNYALRKAVGLPPLKDNYGGRLYCDKGRTSYPFVVLRGYAGRICPAESQVTCNPTTISDSIKGFGDWDKTMLDYACECSMFNKQYLRNVIKAAKHQEDASFHEDDTDDDEEQLIEPELAKFMKIPPMNPVTGEIAADSYHQILVDVVKFTQQREALKIVEYLKDTNNDKKKGQTTVIVIPLEVGGGGQLFVSKTVVKILLPSMTSVVGQTLSFLNPWMYVALIPVFPQLIGVVELFEESLFDSQSLEDAIQRTGSDFLVELKNIE